MCILRPCSSVLNVWESQHSGVSLVRGASASAHPVVVGSSVSRVLPSTRPFSRSPCQGAPCAVETPRVDRDHLGPTKTRLRFWPRKNSIRHKCRRFVSRLVSGENKSTQSGSVGGEFLQLIRQQHAEEKFTLNE